MIETERLLSPEARTAYAEDGFVSGPRIITDAHADALFGAIHEMVVDDHHRDHGRVYDMGVGGQPLLHLKDMWATHPDFRALLDHPELGQLLFDATGIRRHRLWQDGFFYKPARHGSALGWHQDLARIPVAPGAVGTGIWIALTDVSDPTAGPIRLIERSHRRTVPAPWLASPPLPELGRPLRAPFLRDGDEDVTAIVPKGHVHLHDGWVLHGSTANLSDRPRCGLLLFFVDGDARLDPDHPGAEHAPEAAEGRWHDAQHPVVELGELARTGP